MAVISPFLVFLDKKYITRIAIIDKNPDAITENPIPCNFTVITEDNIAEIKYIEAKT